MEFWKQWEQSMKRDEAERAAGASSHAARRHHKPPPTGLTAPLHTEPAAGLNPWKQDCLPDKLAEESCVQVLPIGLQMPILRRTPDTPLKPSSDRLSHPSEGAEKDPPPAADSPEPPPKPDRGAEKDPPPVADRPKPPPKPKQDKRAKPEQRSSTADPDKEFLDKFLGITSGPEGARFLSALEGIVQKCKSNTNPWRSVDWSGYKTMRDNLMTLEVNTPEVEYLRILVHGPVGAGKSSFINSIASIFQERISNEAAVNAIADTSFTKTLQTHYIRDGKSTSFLPFAMCDIMGLESRDRKGVQPEDVIKVLQGHIKDGFKFSETKACAKRDSFYTKNTHLSERIHCLVSVIPADIISNMENAVISKMRKISHEAVDLRIPHMVVLTKVDLICPAVDQDLKLIYRSKKIKDKMEECSNILGVPMNCIFPVRNYHKETDLIDEVNVLLLHALSHILDCAEDHVVKMAHSLARATKRK